MNRNKTLTAILLCAALVGCGGAPPPAPPALQPSAAPPPQPAAGAQAPAPAPSAPVIPEPKFSYNPEGRRDPFRSIVVASEKGREGLENLPPLQRRELSEFRLIGVIWGGFGYTGMLMTPDGKGYTVRVGTRVGVNNGIVKGISERQLVVEERVTDIFGEKRVREVVFDLHPIKEGAQ